MTNRISHIIRKTLSALVVFSLMLTMLLTFAPNATLAAEAITLDLTNGSIVIYDNGYTQDGDALQTSADLDGYVYTITSSAATANTVQVVSGNNVRITLNNVDIHTGNTTATSSDAFALHCPISILPDANVELTFEGGNSLTASGGYAGIYVAEDASLNIMGTGSLTVNGGDGDATSPPRFYGGGAGIGGNGHEDSISFGSVTISGGTIIATGGASSTSTSFGAGAGIGSGGISGLFYEDPANPNIVHINVNGNVSINAGTVTAQGGKSANSSATVGGAGIGSGGAGGFAPYSDTTVVNNILVNIMGGDISSTGAGQAAGIGGGDNMDPGTINIIGGNVLAVGASDGGANSAWSGAGIGGGCNGWKGSITIGGNAVVYATSKGASAAIGGGYLGGHTSCSVGELTITITGDAIVEAFGGTGTGTRADRSGAGIGAGHPGSYNPNTLVYTRKDASILNITFAGNANITAIAGYGASAVGGAGLEGNGDVAGDVLNLDSTTLTLLLANKDEHGFADPLTSRLAYIDNLQGVGVPQFKAYTYVGSDEYNAGNDFPGQNTETDTTLGARKWKYDSGNNGGFVLTLIAEDATGLDETFNFDIDKFGNWAVMAAPAAAAAEHEITASVNNPLYGSIAPSGVVTVSDGADIIFTFTPNAGYRVAYVLIDGVPTALNGAASYTFTNVTEDHTIEVVFVAISTTDPIEPVEPQTPWMPTDPVEIPLSDPGVGGMDIPDETIDIPLGSIPQTGDSSSIIGFVMLGVAAVFGVVMLVRRKLREE